MLKISLIELSVTTVASKHIQKEIKMFYDAFIFEVILDQLAYHYPKNLRLSILSRWYWGYHLARHMTVLITWSRNIIIMWCNATILTTHVSNTLVTNFTEWFFTVLVLCFIHRNHVNHDLNQKHQDTNFSRLKVKE